MSTEFNKEIVRRFIEMANTGNVELIGDFISRDYTEIYDGKRHEVGIEGAKNHILGVRQTYPDLHLTIGQQIAEGEWVATCITAQGTHKGVWLDMKPTGKTIAFTGVNIDRVVNGRIVEHGGAVNTFEALLGAGAVKLVKVND